MTAPRKGLGRNAIARHFGVNPSSVNGWVNKGCPRLDDETFDSKAVKKWLGKRKTTAASSSDKREQKLDAEIARIQKQCRQQDLDYSRASEAVHPRDQCCASLSRVISDHLTPLLNVGSRLATQFPELGKRLKDAADAEVDAAFNAIREGLPK